LIIHKHSLADQHLCFFHGALSFAHELVCRLSLNKKLLYSHGTAIIKFREVKFMSLGQMIKLCRKEKGFTQSELAELIGVSMQAVSKWETDAGMPDISQIVPLAKVLEVSSDKLLGLCEYESSEELAILRKQIGHHTISFGHDEAQRIYDLAVPYFSAHPTNSEVAFWCIESLAELLAFDDEKAKQPQILMECERYANCIFRYETDADRICKTYYVMSRAYNLLGESKKSTDMLDRLPVVFGDRTYWEAEFAFADRNMSLSLQKMQGKLCGKGTIYYKMHTHGKNDKRNRRRRWCITAPGRAERIYSEYHKCFTFRWQLYSFSPNIPENLTALSNDMAIYGIRQRGKSCRMCKAAH
jgi:transcriptional regulator with XRE-family HTH domain